MESTAKAEAQTRPVVKKVDPVLAASCSKYTVTDVIGELFDFQTPSFTPRIPPAQGGNSCLRC